MIRGIGIDTVYVPRITSLLEKGEKSFFTTVFTEYERECAAHRHDTDMYYASRFAAKEAVFKACGHLLPERHLSLFCIETRNRDDGTPYIAVTDELQSFLDEAGVTSLEISITTERDYASAFVIAQSE